ncbi:MAG: ACP phosphodiesterase [Luteolibacter sp.]
MNFLAHLYLAEPTDESLVGNLLGDFAKGLPSTLEERFPPGVVRGILQHRAVDAFTDRHPTFSQARRLLSPHRSRLAGIVVDVLYDYFLSTRWPDGDAARLEFIEHCHGTLLAHDEWLSPQLRAVLPRMISENWLGSYSSIGGLALTFRRVATRSPVAAGVLGAEEDFVKHQDQLEKLYNEFFPDLETFSKQWLAARD